jgi:hypothetical protein
MCLLPLEIALDCKKITIFGVFVAVFPEALKVVMFERLAFV